MPLTITTVTFLAGLALIVVGIFGGGIEVKEIKIPTLPIVSRALSFAMGLGLIGLCIANNPQILSGQSGNAGSPSASQPSPPAVSVPAPSQSAAEDKSKLFLGAAIQNHLVSVHEVKSVLHHLNKYNGAMNDDPSEE